MKALITSSQNEILKLVKHIELILDIKIVEFNGHEVYFVLYSE